MRVVFRQGLTCFAGYVERKKNKVFNIYMYADRQKQRLQAHPEGSGVTCTSKAILEMEAILNDPDAELIMRISRP